MNAENITIFIHALKKNVAFPDDLVKKLADVTLIQRAINKAYDLGVDKNKIHLLTDSEEIRLIAERNSVRVYWEPELVWNHQTLQNGLYRYILKAAKHTKYILILSPYAPLVSAELIMQAVKALGNSELNVLKPVKKIQRQLFDANERGVLESVFGITQETHLIEFSAFTLLESKVIYPKRLQQVGILPWEVGNDLMEIGTYQDWWVCEKLLQRKRIVFRVIGNETVGMGHIYRALALAHEITDHEILFVSDTGNTIAVNKLAGHDYWLGIFEPDILVQEMINLKPDMVINDILATDVEYVSLLKANGIKVVNFEDLGEGAQIADLTVNELYDKPKIDCSNILWGHNYFFLRDEFQDAKPHRFKKKVDAVLLAFGGTDQNDLSGRIYRAVLNLCKERNIKVNIVTGAGYKRYESLAAEVEREPNVSLTRATGVISSIMEQSQIAIASNGRTVYELAHMNIPSIVISQHTRENTHGFACDENGFIPLGLDKQEKTENEVQLCLRKLLDDDEYRRGLFDRIKHYKFSANRQRVLRKILLLLDDKKEDVSGVIN